MITITEFLTARLGDDEAYAREAAAEFGPDWIEIWSGTVDLTANLPGRQPPDGRHWDAHVVTNDARVSCHMVRWDPARALADVAAKRAIVAAHETFESRVEAATYTGYDALNYHRDQGTLSALKGTLRYLALPYADHPDYDERWRP